MRANRKCGSDRPVTLWFYRLEGSHLLVVGEVGWVTMTTGVGVPLRSGVHVAVDGVVTDAGSRHRPVMMMMMLKMLLLSRLLVPLSRRYVGRRSGRLRPPAGRLVLLPGDGAELCQGDGGRRGGWLGPPAGLRPRVQQGGLGLLPPVLEGLGLLGVDSEGVLGEGPGIRGGGGSAGGGLLGRSHAPTASPTALARRPGLMSNSLCACWLLDGRRSVLLGHVRLWKVIRISQSSCIGALQRDGSL